MQARRRRVLLRRRPDQRDRLGQVADIIVGIAEQHLVHALHGERAQHGRLDAGDGEVAGDDGERIAAVGIGLATEIIDEQPQLAVAGRRQDKAVEEGRESLHGRRLYRGGARPSLSGQHFRGPNPSPAAFGGTLSHGRGDSAAPTRRRPSPSAWRGAFRAGSAADAGACFPSHPTAPARRARPCARSPRHGAPGRDAAPRG